MSVFTNPADGARDEADAYVRAILDLLGDRDPFQVLEELPAPLADALDQVRVLRRANLRLVRSLSPEQLRRAGVHAERGEETLEHLVRLYAGHDLVHRRQLERIRAGL